ECFSFKNPNELRFKQKKASLRAWLNYYPF
ncbi:MAG: hypothetical protein ACI9U0_002495, partial [Flavobacteriales bacterium]